MGCHGGANNRELVLLAAVTAFQIADELTPDQMATLSAFFSALGDNLGILSSSPLFPADHKKDTEG